MKSDFKNLNEKKNRLVKELQSEITDLEQKVKQDSIKKKDMKQTIKQLNQDVLDLNKKLYEKCDVEVNIKGDKYNVYSDDIRKTAIGLVSGAGVSAANVRKAIEIVAQNVFKYVFKDNLPSMQTVLNMVDEGYVLSQVQVMEGVLNSKKCNFA